MNKRLIGILLLIGQNIWMFVNWAYSALQPANIYTWITLPTFVIVGIGALTFVLSIILMTAKRTSQGIVQ